MFSSTIPTRIRTIEQNIKTVGQVTTLCHSTRMKSHQRNQMLYRVLLKNRIMSRNLSVPLQATTITITIITPFRVGSTLTSRTSNKNPISSPLIAQTVLDLHLISILKLKKFMNWIRMVTLHSWKVFLNVNQILESNL